MPGKAGRAEEPVIPRVSRHSMGEGAGEPLDQAGRGGVRSGGHAAMLTSKAGRGIIHRGEVRRSRAAARDARALADLMASTAVRHLNVRANGPGDTGDRPPGGWFSTTHPA